MRAEGGVNLLVETILHLKSGTGLHCDNDFYTNARHVHWHFSVRN